MRASLATACGAVTLLLSLQVEGREIPAGHLSFEACGPFGKPGGWLGGPLETLALDSVTVHSGRLAGRIERSDKSPSEFTAMTLSIPIDFSGQFVELRGWLRLEGVENYAGLWQRQDGPSGMLHLDNMSDKKLSGSVDWQQYSVKLPLDPKARTLVFGALLVGAGRLWVDDLEILVDDHPLAEAPEVVRARTAIDTDHEFDAGSKIEATALTPLQIDNLALLGKVWGFVKYHHPRVTTAQVHWDYELFRITPQVLAARNWESAQKTLTNWLKKLGDAPACKPCAQLPSDAQLLPQLGWISDPRFVGTKLSARLKQIYVNRAATDEQHYVSLNPGVKNPDFAGEAAYKTSNVPDAGYRLLALYRFWNIIEYWFPYRNVMEENWDQVLSEFIPRVFAAANADDYALALMALVARVHDTHANLWSSLDVRPPRGDCELPVIVRFVEGRPVVAGYTTSDAQIMDAMQLGDAFVALDGTPVDSLMALWRPYYATSNDAAEQRDMARSMTRGPCEPLRVRREREGQLAEVTIERSTRTKMQAKMPGILTHDQPGETFRRLSNDLAYLKLSSVEAVKAEEYVRGADGARCLIIDVRNYPSEFMVFALTQHLIVEKTEFACFTKGDLTNPGAFVWTPSVAVEPKSPHFDGRIVILVDEVSQSAAEYTTMALRAVPGALVVGSTTAGADGNVSPIPLPGGLRAMISGIGVFYPDHRPTQRLGIIPDVVVRPTRAGIRAGRDEVLEAGVRAVLERELTAEEREALADEGIATHSTQSESPK